MISLGDMVLGNWGEKYRYWSYRRIVKLKNDKRKFVFGKAPICLLNYTK